MNLASKDLFNKNGNKTSIQREKNEQQRFYKDLFQFRMRQNLLIRTNTILKSVVINIIIWKLTSALIYFVLKRFTPSKINCAQLNKYSFLNVRVKVDVILNQTHFIHQINVCFFLKFL